MEEYLDEFDYACAAVANGDPIPAQGSEEVTLALQALCFTANQARLNYAIIRSKMAAKNPQVGVEAFSDKLP